MRLLNAVAATAFAIGGSLFAIGAALAQSGVDATACASVYMVGGAFFSTGGYASVLLVVNQPRPGPDGAPQARAWRWWSHEPDRLEWLSAVALFAGTIVFAINLTDSFIADLGAGTEDRLVWSPDVVGCTLFLVSGQFALAGFRRESPRRHRRDLDWWIVVVNQLGSVLFMVSAVASFVRPTTGDELAVGIANWGTLTGALCFAIAGLMQELDRPASA
jgi:hypothetical protein